MSWQKSKVGLLLMVRFLSNESQLPLFSKMERDETDKPWAVSFLTPRPSASTTHAATSEVRKSSSAFAVEGISVNSAISRRSEGLNDLQTTMGVPCATFPTSSSA